MTKNLIKMKSYTVKFIIILMITVNLVGSQRWSDYNNVVNKSEKNKRSGAYVGDHDNEKSVEPNVPPKSQPNKFTSRGGIGGWGIIAITLTIIFSGIGIYYFVLFYPIVCKKERMYDVMEMTTV